MRKNFASILILVVFLLFQYGRMLSYFYCEWQAVSIAQQKDCGCEIHLWDSVDQQHPATGIIPVNIHDKVEEFFEYCSITALPAGESSLIRSYPPFVESIISVSIVPGLRPPIA